MINAFALIFFLSISGHAIEIHGHRGSRGTHPENTIPAFQEALEAQAEVLEMDLGMSKDNILVLSHDAVVNPELCKFSDGKPVPKNLAIRTLDFSRLQKINCSSLVNKEFPNQKLAENDSIVSLEEVLKWLNSHPLTQAKKVHLNIETKFAESENIKTASPAEYAVEISRLIKKYNFIDRAILQSFDFPVLAEIRKLVPTMKTSMLVYRQTWPEIKRQALKYKPNIISPNHRWLSKTLVNQIHAMDMKVIPWTLNDKSQWQSAISQGVDGIITDYPRELQKYLVCKSPQGC